MARLLSRWTQIAIDFAILSVAFWGAYALRFNGSIPEQMFKRLLFQWPYVIAFQYVMLASFGVPRFAWRYFGLRETTRVAAALGSAAAALLAVRIVGALFFDVLLGPAQYATVPLGITVIDLTLAFLA